MGKNPILLCAILLILTVSSCSPSGEGGAASEKIVAVSVLTLESRPMPVMSSSIGRLNPFREVSLAPEISGVVSGYFADVGDEVKKGAVLMTLDPKDHRLAVSQAAANQDAAKSRLYAAEKTYHRLKALLPRHVISAETFEKAEADYKISKAAFFQAKALADISRERLKKTAIRSPFSGFVASRNVEVGLTAAPGQPVMTIADIKFMRLLIHLPEGEYVHLDKNDGVSVFLPAFQGMEFEGEVHRIGIKADERTHTFPVEIMLKNQEFKIKAGMSAEARISLEIIPDAVMIPQSAVIYRENNKEVFIVGPNGAALARTVTLGRSLNDRVHVTQGLAPGDRLIVSGGQYVESGDKIRIIEDR